MNMSQSYPICAYHWRFDVHRYVADYVRTDGAIYLKFSNRIKKNYCRIHNSCESRVRGLVVCKCVRVCLPFFSTQVAQSLWLSVHLPLSRIRRCFINFRFISFSTLYQRIVDCLAFVRFLRLMLNDERLCLPTDVYISTCAWCERRILAHNLRQPLILQCEWLKKKKVSTWSSLVDCRCAKFSKFQLFSIALCKIILWFA